MSTSFQVRRAKIATAVASAAPLLLAASFAALTCDLSGCTRHKIVATSKSVRAASRTDALLGKRGAAGETVARPPGDAPGIGTDSAAPSANGDSMARVDDSAGGGGALPVALRALDGPFAPAVPEPGSEARLGAAGQRDANDPGVDLMPFATARLAPQSGSSMHGIVHFARAASGGVMIVATIEDAKPGAHDLHLYDSGNCRALDASSAGGPDHPSHGVDGTAAVAARHADFGNIAVGADGIGHLTRTIAPAAGQRDPASTWIGKAVVVHDDSDDLKTQPAGISGARVACGVVEPDGAALGH